MPASQAAPLRSPGGPLFLAARRVTDKPAQPLHGSASSAFENFQGRKTFVPKPLCRRAAMKAPSTVPLGPRHRLQKLSASAQARREPGVRANGGRLGRGGDTMDKRSERIQTRVLVLGKKGRGWLYSSRFESSSAGISWQRFRGKINKRGRCLERQQERPLTRPDCNSSASSHNAHLTRRGRAGK